MSQTNNKPFACQECGKRMSTAQAERAFIHGCAKCGSTDVDLHVQSPAEAQANKDRVPAPDGPGAQRVRAQQLEWQLNEQLSQFKAYRVRMLYQGDWKVVGFSDSEAEVIATRRRWAPFGVTELQQRREGRWEGISR